MIQIFWIHNKPATSCEQPDELNPLYQCQENLNSIVETNLQRPNNLKT